MLLIFNYRSKYIRHKNCEVRKLSEADKLDVETDRNMSEVIF